MLADSPKQACILFSFCGLTLAGGVIIHGARKCSATGQTSAMKRVAFWLARSS